MDNLNTYYHYTNYNCMNGISKEGLVPQIGNRSMSKCDDRKGVFLSQGIYNSINMYASMLNYYNVHSDKGKEELNHLYNILNKLDEEKNKISFYNIKQGIYALEYILSCENFVDYLGGDGYLLSIDELDNVVSITPEDCYYNDIVPVNIIHTVILRNEETGDIIDSREFLMNYFVKTIPYNNLLSIIQNEEMLDNLISYLSKYDYVDYDGYEIQEVLIDFYNYNVKKIRPVIFDSNKKH